MLSNRKMHGYCATKCYYLRLQTQQCINAARCSKVFIGCFINFSIKCYVIQDAALPQRVLWLLLQFFYQILSHISSKNMMHEIEFFIRFLTFLLAVIRPVAKSFSWGGGGGGGYEPQEPGPNN